MKVTHFVTSIVCTAFLAICALTTLTVGLMVTSDTALAQSGSRVCYNGTMAIEVDKRDSCNNFWYHADGEKRTFNSTKKTCEDFSEFIGGGRFDICDYMKKSGDYHASNCTKRSSHKGRDWRVYTSCVYARTQLLEDTGWAQTPTCGATSCTKSVSASTSTSSSHSRTISSTGALNYPLWVGVSIGASSSEANSTSYTVTASCTYQKGSYLKWKVSLSEIDIEHFDWNVDMLCEERTHSSSSLRTRGHKTKYWKKRMKRKR